jgi:hypothetical protein
MQQRAREADLPSLQEGAHCASHGGLRVQDHYLNMQVSDKTRAAFM